MQAHEKAAISTPLHHQKAWEQFFITFIPFLTMHTWKTFSISPTTFIKISALEGRNVVERMVEESNGKVSLLTLYCNEMMERSLN